MPEFSAEDRKTIDDYVGKRLAAGDAPAAIGRELAAHWQAMDKANPEPAVPECMPIPGNGGVPLVSVESGVASPTDGRRYYADGGPVTHGEIAAMQARGMSLTDIAREFTSAGRK